MIESRPARKPHPYAHAPKLPTEGPVDVASLTASDLPLEVEIGPGRGAFILERAKEAPHVALVGLEIRWKWASIVDERLAKAGFRDRARVYAADARFLLPRWQPDACIDRFYIHFPDPWWKKRQQKRMVVSPSFIQQMVRLLKPGGILYVQTDVLERADHYEMLLSSMEGLIPDGDQPGSAFLSNPSWTARSNRERRVIEAGLQPSRFQFRKP
jgi:tRNA (guanine-N7-)-methyltransferase